MSQIIPQRRRRGDWAELRFMARAIAHGFTVSKPWGNARYDFLVEHEERISRVQVKSTTHVLNGLYQAAVSRRYPRRLNIVHRYTAEEIDFFALYVVPADAWYIVPYAAVANRKSYVGLNPKSPRNKYFRYLEAWDLLRAPATVRKKSRTGAPS